MLADCLMTWQDMCVQWFVVSKQMITEIVFVEQLVGILDVGRKLNRAQCRALRNTVFNCNRI